MALSIGVDIGGTKVAAGALTDIGELVDCRVLRLHDRRYDAVLKLIDGEIDRLEPQSRRSTPVGVALAGWLSADRRTVLHAANLGWEHVPLQADLRRHGGRSVRIVNDGDAAAWGEWDVDELVSPTTLVMLTLGTDVGGGVVVDGHLVTGALGLGGELGHLCVDPNGPPCVCGARGCLAVFASGSAMLTAARRIAVQQPGMLRQLSADDPATLTGDHLGLAARRGDPAALQILTDAARAIAHASAQISRVVDHSMLVLGGGAARVGRPLSDAVAAALASLPPLGGIAKPPSVRLARLGAFAGVHGAAALAARTSPSPWLDTPATTNRSSHPRSRAWTEGHAL